MEQGQVHLSIPAKKKKILHFSDGVEEVTDSENEMEATEVDCRSQITPLQSEPVIDESTMEWAPWLALKSKQTGETILNGCDYVGEFLASALGITSPKFVDGEEELKKAEAEQRERDEESAEEIREMDTWRVDTATTVTEPPVSPTPVVIHEDTERQSSNRY